MGVKAMRSSAEINVPLIVALQPSETRLEFPAPSQSLRPRHPLRQFATAAQRPYGSRIAAVYAQSDNLLVPIVYCRHVKPTVGLRANASCTSTFFRFIVQSSLFSISSKLWYMCESSANSGSCARAFGTDLSVILRLLRIFSVF